MVHLYWRPPPAEREEHCVGYGLKFHLSEALWGHDGSLYGDWTLMGKEWLSFLRGVASAGRDEVREEAKELIKQIEKYGEVEVALL
jgi:hypothetical protein